MAALYLAQQTKLFSQTWRASGNLLGLDRNKTFLDSISSGFERIIHLLFFSIFIIIH